MAFLLTTVLVLQTLLGNAAEGPQSYDYFFYGNYTFFFTDNYTYDYPTESYTNDYTLFGKDVTESAGSSLQGHLPFFVVLLHLLCFLLQRLTNLL